MTPIPMNLLLAAQAVVMLLALALAVRTIGKARQAKQSQDRLIETLERGASDSWFRVNVSRHEKFVSRFKLVGFEAKGLLVNTPDRIRILAELASGERIDQWFKKSDLGLRWIGNPGMASANMHWIAVGPADRSLYLSADTGFNALQSREATADLCRMIDPAFPLSAVATREFALEKNPASLAIVAAFFSLVAFAFLDGIIVNKNELLALGWLRWAAPVSMLLAFPAYWWLIHRGVPARESLTLTMLLGMAITAAHVPAIKRADQLLSEDGATAVAYRLGANAKLEPVIPGPPAIDYSRRQEYWAQFDKGSIHYFDLTHGPLGLWQLDHSTLEGKLRAFYDNSNASRNH